MSEGADQKDAKPGICEDRRRQVSMLGSYRKLCVAEPFRIFFPLAVLVSVVAVMLWPAMFWGWIGFFPREMHGRLLMQGFVGGFAFGFMATALPNTLSSPRFKGWEVGVMLLLYLGMLTGHLLQRSGWGDGLFLGLIVFFGIGLVRRFLVRKDLPPPGFVLVAGGLLCALTGTVLFLVDRAMGVDLFRSRLANLFLFQGFMLLPLLGIGAFLFPRFFGTENRQIFPDGRTPPPGWWAKALMAAVVGLVVVVSFGVEAGGSVKVAGWMRFVVCALYFSTETGWWRVPRKGGILPWGVRLGILFTLGAHLVTALLEAHRVALDHALYVGGFGLLALVVGTRVLLGHAGRSDLMGRWLKPVMWMVVMVALAALTRVSANFLPQVMVSHWIYAALAWVAGVVVWAVFVLRWVGRAEE